VLFCILGCCQFDLKYLKAKSNTSISYCWRIHATGCIVANGKIEKWSCDHNHAQFSGWCHPLVTLDVAYLWKKFDDSSFSYSWDMIEALKIKLDHMMWPRPFRDGLSSVGWDLQCSTHIPDLKSLQLSATKIRKATQNVEIVVVRGHSRSSAMLPFDRAHTTS